MIAPLIAKTLRPGPNQAPDVAIGLAEAGHEAFFSRFRIAQTSGQVYLEQNLMPELILRSICLQLPQNLPKTSKNVAKFSEKNYIVFGIPDPHSMDELKEELNEITKGKPL